MPAERESAFIAARHRHILSVVGVYAPICKTPAPPRFVHGAKEALPVARLDPTSSVSAYGKHPASRHLGSLTLSGTARTVSGRPSAWLPRGW